MCVYIYKIESPSLSVEKARGCGAWGHGLVVNMTVLVKWLDSNDLTRSCLTLTIL